MKPRFVVKEIIFFFCLCACSASVLAFQLLIQKINVFIAVTLGTSIHKIKGPNIKSVFPSKTPLSFSFSVYFLPGGQGSDGSSSSSLSSGYSLHAPTSRFSSLPPMNQARRDHACLFVEFEHDKGVLVTGGKKHSTEVYVEGICEMWNFGIGTPSFPLYPLTGFSVASFDRIETS